LVLFAEVYANLWPLDPTPRLLLKTLIHYQYAAGYGSERERCRMMEEYLDEVLRESAGRYNRGKPPLAFRQLKERWRDFTERAGSKYKPTGTTNSSDKSSNSGQNTGNSNNNSGGGKQKSNQSNSNQPNQAGQSNRGRGSKPARSGFLHRSGALRFQGKLICYLYNNKGPGCQRPAVSGGCDDGKGGSFAHVCNFETSPGQVCAAAHPRSKNH
jgi:hypothetical protein